MLTEDRKYHYIGELNIKRSRVLDENTLPKDDKTNWFFLNTGKQQLSFVYKLEEPAKASYGSPFKILLSFTMIEIAKDTLQLNRTYEILRGQENIGTINLISTL